MRTARASAINPGWSLPVLRRLFEDRAIRACGHETTDTDPGIATSRNDYSLERYVLGRNCWQIEMLTNLDQVPEAGALIVATWPKAEKGSGFPAPRLRDLPARRNVTAETMPPVRAAAANSVPVCTHQRRNVSAGQ